MSLTLSERHLLANFLRTRRERLSPATYGFAGQRRRTPGLRREEVAQIAGISTTWYTWLEQGREIHTSAQVLERIAYALRLEPHETRYLFTLAKLAPDGGQTLLAPQKAAVSAPSAITPAIRYLLDHQGDCPAYVLGRYWGFLAWNAAADTLFGGLASLPDDQQHMIGYVFLRAATRTLLPDWEARAQAITAEFRADCSQYATDPYFVQLVNRYRAASPEFERMWGQHEVRPRAGGRRTFNHPQLGLLALEQVTLMISSAPDVKMVILLPLV